ncbi:MAG: hypothetical protein BWK77_05590 [Verrucomicrobia bacterium A1]|nr:MAG: hypothetical protein BWK77_05590 [Verrucomicrobia bacterium A1]
MLNLSDIPCRRPVRRIRRFAASAAVWMLAAAAGAVSPDEQMQFADGLYARGLHDLAIREYMALLRDSPTFPKMDQVLYRIAESYRETGNGAAADLFYRRVVREHAQSLYRHRAELRRAELFIAANQPVDGIGILTDLVKAGPPAEILAGARYYLGVAAVMTNGAAQAESEWKAVMSAHAATPYAALAAMELGALKQKSGAPAAEAMALYRKAAETAASSNVAAEAWFRLGDLACAEGRHNVASEAYGRLLKDHPAHPRAAEARLQAAWSLVHTGLAADALKLAVTAPKEGKDADEWLYLAGNGRRQLLDDEGAMQAYDDLAARFPASRLAGPAAYESALIRFKQRKYDEVIRRLTAVPPAGSLRVDVDWLLAESYSGAGRTNEAVQHYRRIAEMSATDPRAPDALYRLGRLLHERGDRAEASNVLRSLAARHPKHETAPGALLVSGFALAADGHAEEAIVDWSRLARDYAASPLAEEALYQKGLSEIRLKREPQALESLGDLLKRFSKTRFEADARYWRGIVMENAGETAAAEEELRRAAALDAPPDVRRKIRYRLAGVLHKLKKPSEAADLLQGLLNTPSQDDMSPALLEWLATLRIEQGAFTPAAEAAQTLLAHTTDESWVQIGGWLLGRARIGLKDSAGAIEAFEKGAAGRGVTRARLEALIELGRLYLESGKPDLAEARFSAAAELASDAKFADPKARALHGLGGAAAARGQWEVASRYFLSVAILFDHPVISAECLYRAAGAFEHMKQADRAAQLIQELRQRYPDSEWAKKPAPVSAPSSASVSTNAPAPGRSP